MQKSKQFLQFLKSLKFRLILLIVVIAVVPSLILSAAVLKYYEKRAVSIRESEILSQAKILANQIATSEYMKLGQAECPHLLMAVLLNLLRAASST